MVTGQSVVLYSRLHLILKDRTQLRTVLIMIIVDAMVCHVPITVLAYGMSSNNPDPFRPIMPIFEKIQLIIFFLQELIISGLYIRATAHFLQNNSIIRRNTDHGMMKHLLYVNFIIIVLDTPILALEFAKLHRIQTSYKSFVYGAKLKLEFSILNQLIDITTFRNGTQNHQSGNNGYANTRFIKDKTEPGHSAHIQRGGKEELELRNDALLMMGGLSATPSERQLVPNTQPELNHESASADGRYTTRNPALSYR
ncbi:hypothetical protein BGZ63DRAFT_397088 [Mariannaea sp. PMI_226]|nr:hypothetical protein BGZ63DRAFT_397088 [Mariannaea sp. PMI_226]